VADTLAEIDEVGFLEDPTPSAKSAQGAHHLLTRRPGSTPRRASKLQPAQNHHGSSLGVEILYRKYYNDEVRKLGSEPAASRLESSLASTRVLLM